MKKLLHATAALALAAGLGTAAHAQQAVKSFPPGLDWQTMALVGFNYNNAPQYQGRKGDRDTAWAIWGKTIQALPIDKYHGDNKWPTSVLSKGFESDDDFFIFTSMATASVAYPACSDAINSKDINTPIYVFCPMRLSIKNRATGKIVERDYPNFCHIASNSKDQPISRNYEQVAVDNRTHTAYFRVVQYGKPAPACNRAIKLN